MGRKIAYWAATGILSAMSLFAGYAYLSGNPQAVEGFAHVGYPQQLRVILGIAKPLGAIVLVIPGFAVLKEWAYAGFTFAWIAAACAHYLAGEKTWPMPLLLLVLLTVSYLTRDERRRVRRNEARAPGGGEGPQLSEA
jgi:DoxX-like protein